ncbi:MAG: HEPN domain-containing protein [Asgard group archaeon]|nr:HEPN domain-containing protein [Asgard group archaeon]
MNREKDWLYYSEELLEIAELLITNAKYSWACFTLHQATTAALKSILSRMDESTFGDNLIKLVRAIGQNTNIPDEVKKSCHKLNDYFNMARDLEAKSDGTPLSNFSLAEAKSAKNNTLVVIRFAHHMSH